MAECISIAPGTMQVYPATPEKPRDLFWGVAELFEFGFVGGFELGAKVLGVGGVGREEIEGALDALAGQVFLVGGEVGVGKAVVGVGRIGIGGDVEF